MSLDRIGRYEIQRRLGTGGMGSLYLARDPALDRLVAIKLLKDDYQDDEELRERFVREARSVARLRHPNIVLVFDVGEHEGRQFMAMEYLAGETLTKLLARRPPVPLVRRLMLGEQLCAGLAHAHAAGIVHRDIKPSNIMLDVDGVLKILDFGIAHLADSGITQDGMMMGSVNYMSPEQISGQRVDHRTDIFAAGAVLHELVSLTQAFPGGIDSGVLNRILHEGAPPLTKTMPGINPVLAEIVNRALEREPDRRYQDAESMRRDLVHLRKSMPDGLDETDATVVRPRASASPSTAGRGEDTGRDRRHRIESGLARARTSIEDGRFDTAMRQIGDLLTLDPDNPEARELQSQATSGLTAQHEHDRRRQQARERIDAARALASDRRFKEAAETLAAITPPSDTMRRSIAELSAIIEDKRREATREAMLATIRGQIDSGAFAEALAALEAIPAAERTGEMRALQIRIENGLRTKDQLERKRVELNRLVTTARHLYNAGDFAGAREVVGEGFRLVGDDAALTEVLDEIARAENTAEQKRVADIGDRLASKKIEAARQMAVRDIAAAVAFLETDDSAHPAIGSLLQELRAEAVRRASAPPGSEPRLAHSGLAADPQTARQQADLEKDQDSSRTVVRPQRSRQSRGSDTAAPATATGGAQAPPVPVPAPLPPARRSNAVLIGVAALVVIAAIAGVLMMRGRSSEAPQATAQPPNASPPPAVTTIPPSAPPEPQTAPQPAPQPGTTEIDRIVQNARAAMKQGNLTVAARTIADGAMRAPQDAGVQAAIQEIVTAASAQAQQARTAADRANAQSRPAYEEGLAHLRSAEAMKAARRADSAVSEYATAERMFAQAARAPQVAQVSTALTSIPAAEPTNAPRPATPSPTVQSSVATTSIAPTTITPGIDDDTVQRVLQTYANASRTFNVGAIEQIYPGLPSSTRLRLDALRKNFSFCDYRYSNVKIVSSTPTDATVRADSQESCKPKTGQRAIESSATQQLHLKKGASGAWTISEILGLQ